MLLLTSLSVDHLPLLENVHFDSSPALHLLLTLPGSVCYLYEASVLKFTGVNFS